MRSEYHQYLEMFAAKKKKKKNGSNPSSGADDATFVATVAATELILFCFIPILDPILP